MVVLLSVMVTLKGTSSGFDKDKIVAFLLLGWKVKCFKNIFSGGRGWFKQEVD